MTKEQLQTIADLVAIAHDEYDGRPSYRDDLERFDRVLAEMEAEAQLAPGNAAAMREALVAAKEGVYTSAYCNRFAVVSINLCGYRFAINADHSSFRPRIKVVDQKDVLNRVVDELVDCINKGAAARAALAAPPEPPSNAAAMREALVEILDRTNREKARDYDAALNGGVLEIHDIANTALNETKGE